MMGAPIRWLMLLGAGGLLSQPAIAAQSKTTVDLTVGAGYSSNPLLRVGGRSSASLNVSALVQRLWETETSSTSLRLVASNIAYLREYGNKQVFSVDAETSRSLSSTVSVFGRVTFSGDVGGQLSNRFDYSDITEPNGPLPADPTDFVDYGLSSQRQYRLAGQIGGSARLSPRDSISLGAEAEHVFYSSKYRDLGYDLVGVNASYARKVSEAVDIGGSLSGQHYNYRDGLSSNVLRPAVTFTVRVAERLTASGSVGLLYLKQHAGDFHRTKIGPYISASFCHRGELDNLCLSISRDVQPSSGSFRDAGERGGASVSNLASINYSRQIGDRQILRASLSGGRYSLPDIGDTSRSRTVFTALAGYDRPIGRRLAGGVNLGARKIAFSGPDPRSDLSASAYLRYSFGDVQ